MTGIAARRLGLGLCVVLSLCTLMVLLDRTRDLSDPTITSAKPSGTRLFSELLEQSGVEVDLNRSRWPRLSQQQVAIAFVRTGENGVEWPGGAGIQTSFTELAASGQTVVAFYVPEDLNAADGSARNLSEAKNLMLPSQDVMRVSGGRFFPPEEIGSIFQSPEHRSDQRRAPLEVWSQNGQPTVYFESVGKGVVVHVTNGVGATNRFIDQGDNARFFVSLVKGLTGPSRNVVFTEASHGNIVDETLFSGLGGWARAAAWQVFLLFLVVAWTSSISFGSPLRDRRRQAGTRDLMEAFGALMRRRKAPQFPMALVLNAIRRDLKRSVGLSAAASDEALVARLPAGLAARFRSVNDFLVTRPKSLPLQEIEALRLEAREFRTLRQNRFPSAVETVQQESDSVQSSP